MKIARFAASIVTATAIAGLLVGCAKTDADEEVADTSTMTEEQQLEANAELIAKRMARSPDFACAQYAQLLRNNISTGRLDHPAIANAANSVIYKAERMGCL